MAAARQLVKLVLDFKGQIIYIRLLFWKKLCPVFHFVVIFML